MEYQKNINVKRSEKLATLDRLGDAPNTLVSGGVLPQSREVFDELPRKHPYASPINAHVKCHCEPVEPSCEKVWWAL